MSTGVEVGSVGLVNEVAEVVSSKGADPVMLGAVIVMLMMFAGLFAWLMKRSDARQDDVMEDYQARMTRQEDGFKEDLREQRKTHESNLERLTNSFERTMERVVDSNERNLGKITTRMDGIQKQVHILERSVHSRSSSGGLPGNTVHRELTVSETASSVAEPKKRASRKKPAPPKERTSRKRSARVVEQVKDDVGVHTAQVTVVQAEVMEPQENSQTHREHTQGDKDEQ